MPDDRTVFEVFQAVTKGQNGLLDSSFIPQGQASRLYNVEVRNGLAESRPEVDGTALPVQGRFQGAFVYELENNLRWVVVVSGQVWTYNFNGSVWTHVANFPTQEFEQAYFAQAGRYAVVQNGIFDPVENWPIIFHGDTVIDNLDVEFIYRNHVVKVRDFNWDMVDENDELVEPAPEPTPEAYRVPIGKAMAFGQGRLFVAVERFWDHGLTGGTRGWQSGRGLRYIVASDDERFDDPERMFVFTQSDLLTGGGAMTLPVENGFITHLSFFRNSATGTGLGELLVMSRRGSTAFAVSAPREVWGQEGFGQQLFQSSGSSSPWGVVAVNSDLVYYEEGLRTIKYTASNETASGGMASIPISPEVYNFTQHTLAEHKPFVTLAHSSNYVFFTAGGVELADGSVAFKGVLPWDLMNFQVSGEPPSRVFAGAWTGRYAHAVLKSGTEYPGLIYRDTLSGEIKFGVFQSKVKEVSCAVRTGAFIFSSPRNMKRMKYVDLVFDRVRTDLKVRVRWRMDGAGPWYLSDDRNFTVSGPASTGMFRVPIESDNAGVGYRVEFSVEWLGQARLKLALFAGTILDLFKGGEDEMCGTVNLSLDSRLVEMEEEEFFTGSWT